MNVNLDDIQFLESIKYKLNDEEKSRIDEIISFNQKRLKNKVKSSAKSRQNSLYQTKMNRIRVNLAYFKKQRNFEKIAYYENLKKETEEKHKRGEI